MFVADRIRFMGDNNGVNARVSPPVVVDPLPPGDIPEPIIPPPGGGDPGGYTEDPGSENPKPGEPTPTPGPGDEEDPEVYPGEGWTPGQEGYWVLEGIERGSRRVWLTCNTGDTRGGLWGSPNTIDWFAISHNIGARIRKVVSSESGVFVIADNGAWFSKNAWDNLKNTGGGVLDFTKVSGTAFSDCDAGDQFALAVAGSRVFTLSFVSGAFFEYDLAGAANLVHVRYCQDSWVAVEHVDKTVSKAWITRYVVGEGTPPPPPVPEDPEEPVDPEDPLDPESVDNPEDPVDPDAPEGEEGEEAPSGPTFAPADWIPFDIQHAAQFGPIDGEIKIGKIFEQEGDARVPDWPSNWPLDLETYPDGYADPVLLPPIKQVWDYSGSPLDEMALQQGVYRSQGDVFWNAFEVAGRVPDMAFGAGLPYASMHFKFTQLAGWTSVMNQAALEVYNQEFLSPDETGNRYIMEDMGEVPFSNADRLGYMSVVSKTTGIGADFYPFFSLWTGAEVAESAGAFKGVYRIDEEKDLEGGKYDTPNVIVMTGDLFVKQGPQNASWMGRIPGVGATFMLNGSATPLRYVENGQEDQVNVKFVGLRSIVGSKPTTSYMMRAIFGKEGNPSETLVDNQMYSLGGTRHMAHTLRFTFPRPITAMFKMRGSLGSTGGSRHFYHIKGGDGSSEFIQCSTDGITIDNGGKRALWSVKGANATVSDNSRPVILSLVNATYVDIEFSGRNGTFTGQPISNYVFMQRAPWTTWNQYDSVGDGLAAGFFGNTYTMKVYAQAERFERQTGYMSMGEATWEGEIPAGQKEFSVPLTYKPQDPPSEAPLFGEYSIRFSSDKTVQEMFPWDGPSTPEGDANYQSAWPDYNRVRDELVQLEVSKTSGYDYEQRLVSDFAINDRGALTFPLEGHLVVQENPYLDPGLSEKITAYKGGRIKIRWETAEDLEADIPADSSWAVYMMVPWRNVPVWQPTDEENPNWDLYPAGAWKLLGPMDDPFVHDLSYKITHGDRIGKYWRFMMPSPSPSDAISFPEAYVGFDDVPDGPPKGFSFARGYDRDLYAQTGDGDENAVSELKAVYKAGTVQETFTGTAYDEINGVALAVGSKPIDAAFLRKGANVYAWNLYRSGLVSTSTVAFAGYRYMFAGMRAPGTKEPYGIVAPKVLSALPPARSKISFMPRHFCTIEGAPFEDVVQEVDTYQGLIDNAPDWVKYHDSASAALVRPEIEHTGWTKLMSWYREVSRRAAPPEEGQG